MVPYEGPEIRKLQGLFLFVFLPVVDGEVVLIAFCHNYLLLWARLERAMMKLIVVMEMEASEIQKLPDLK